MLLGARYDVGDRLGSGGMAVVHRGHDRLLDRPVALKLLSGDRADATARARFLAEARSAARLSHPNVVAVHDTGEDGDTAYIVLELVDGATLADRLRAGPLTEGESRRVVGMVLDGLAAAHSAGLVHRDVKPGNILLTRDGTAKLADFGIAKALADATGGLTTTGQVLGTPRYLSPEQVGGGEATPASDVYAMGVVLYEALAGHPPFDEPTPLATALAHRDRSPQPLDAVVPDLDPVLAAVVARALEKAPDDRFPDAAAMRAALDEDATGGLSARAAVPVSDAAASTQVLDDDRPAGRVVPWWAVAAALALLVLGALAVGDRFVGGGTAPPGDGPTTPPPAADAGPSDPADAPDLAALIAALSAAGEDAHGEKTEDLFDLLVDVAREEPGDQPEEAESAIEEVEDWVADGELDAAVGARAVELLTPLTAEPR